MTTPQNFSGQNLRGRSFKGQDLVGADFSGADIRGANFTGANLTGANFSGAKAGLRHRQAILLVTISLFLSELSGYFSSYFSGGIKYYFSSRYIDFLNFSAYDYVPGIFLLITLAVFFFVTVYQGFLAGSVAGIVTILASVVLTGAVTGELFSAVSIAINVAVVGLKVGASTLGIMTSASIAIAGAGAVAGLGAGAVAGLTVVAGSLGVGEEAVTGALVTAGLGVFVAWRALIEDEKHNFIRIIAVDFSSIGGTSFRGAILTDVNFTGAILKSIDLRDATLTHTKWHKVKKLELARVDKSILSKRSVRELLVTRRGYQKSYVRENFQGANLIDVCVKEANLKEADISQTNLQGADLEEVNLTTIQAIGTDFTYAHLTGACLESWNIDSTTKLKNVDCKFIYLLEHPKPGTKNDRERRPSSGDFAPGEFTKLFEEVLNTVDLIFQNGIDWRAFIKAFKEIQVQNEATELSIQSIENKGDGVVVVKVSVPEDTNKEEIHLGFTQNYELALKAIEAEYKAKLKGKDKEIRIYRQRNADMLSIINTLAGKTINVEVNAKVENKTMNDSTDNSRKIENKDGNVIGNILGDEGTISGTIAHTINQLPDSPKPDQPGIKELLSQLQKAIETDPELTPEKKAKALKQLQALATAGQDPTSGKDLADDAITMLKGIIASLPSAAALAKTCSELLPSIASLFGL